MAVVIDPSTVVVSNCGRGRLSDISRKLIAGETLFLSPAEAKALAERTYESRGLSLHRMKHELDGVQGFAVWTEPRA